LAAQRKKYGNTTKFSRTRSGFHVKIYYGNKITGPVPLWRGKAIIDFIEFKSITFYTSFAIKVFW